LEGNLLFILQNNLEDFEFKKDYVDEDIDFIKTLINDYKKTPDYICSLERKSFECLKDTSNLAQLIIFTGDPKKYVNLTTRTITEIGVELLTNLLQDEKNGIEKYKEYREKKSQLKEDINYIQESSPYYKKVQYLIEKELNDNFNFDDFIQEFKTLYEDEEFTNMLNFNKKIL